MRKFWWTLLVALSFLVWISMGWEVLLGLWMLVSFLAGVWVIAGWIARALLGPQEARTGDVREVEGWTDYYWTPTYTDPTRPQPHEDEHPVIVLDNYRYRRTR